MRTLFQTNSVFRKGERERERETPRERQTQIKGCKHFLSDNLSLIARLLSNKLTNSVFREGEREREREREGEKRTMQCLYLSAKKECL